jgi:hypothetical protein
MTEGSAALFGAVVGGLASLVGVFISGRLNARSERRKEIREKAAQVFSEMFALHHEMTNVCWFAKRLPEKLDAERVKEYERRANDIWPRLTGATAVLASVSLPIYSQLLPWRDTLSGLEADVSALLHSVDNKGEDAIAALAKHYDALMQIDQRLPKELGEIMQVAD